MKVYSDVWLNYLDLPSGACRQKTFLPPAGANSRDCNVTPELYAATATKTVQAANANKSLQFRRRLSDFFAPVWGLPLVAVYVRVYNKIRKTSLRIFRAGLSLRRHCMGASGPYTPGAETSATHRYKAETGCSRSGCSALDKTFFPLLWIEPRFLESESVCYLIGTANLQE
jgi:hypothetical protein